MRRIEVALSADSKTALDDPTNCAIVVCRRCQRFHACPFLLHLRRRKMTAGQGATCSSGSMAGDAGAAHRDFFGRRRPLRC
eukprot:196237-Pyramimonas_sp.AAC.1